MSAAASHRRLLVTGSGLLYAGVFVAFLVWERPGLGLGHFYYPAIACVALGAGPLAGACGGLVASGLYALGVVLNPAVPSASILTAGTLLRLFTYSAIGALVGAYARSNHSLVERLHVAAERDFLTNLLNARAFEAALERRLEERHPFTLVLGDMDGLKRVNDEHGHAAGNDALRELADGLLRQARHEDDLAELLARLEPLVRGARLGEREDGVHHRPGTAALDELVGALEVGARAHRRAEDRELLPPDAVERRRRVRAARGPAHGDAAAL